jgi:hypothetical protein
MALVAADSQLARPQLIESTLAMFGLDSKIDESEAYLNLVIEAAISSGRLSDIDGVYARGQVAVERIEDIFKDTATYDFIRPPEGNNSRVRSEGRVLASGSTQVHVPNVGRVYPLEGTTQEHLCTSAATSDSQVFAELCARLNQLNISPYSVDSEQQSLRLRTDNLIQSMTVFQSDMDEDTWLRHTITIFREAPVSMRRTIAGVMKSIAESGLVCIDERDSGSDYSARVFGRTLVTNEQSSSGIDVFIGRALLAQSISRLAVSDPRQLIGDEAMPATQSKARVDGSVSQHYLHAEFDVLSNLAPTVTDAAEHLQELRHSALTSANPGTLITHYGENEIEIAGFPDLKLDLDYSLRARASEWHGLAGVSLDYTFKVGSVTERLLRQMNDEIIYTPAARQAAGSFRMTQGGIAYREFWPNQLLDIASLTRRFVASASAVAIIVSGFTN